MTWQPTHGNRAAPLPAPRSATAVTLYRDLIIVAGGECNNRNEKPAVANSVVERHRGRYHPAITMQTRRLLLITFSLLVWLGQGVRLSEAQQLQIQGVFPRQLPRGRSTLISVVVPSRDAIRSAEISPSEGVKVSGIKQGANFQGALTWSEISIDVADDAPPGDRTLVLEVPMGRTAPVTVTIPNHVPNISGLRIVAQPQNQPLEMQFAAADASADLGDSPYVWFMFHCGNELHPGVVRGKVIGQDKNNVAVNASVPDPSARGACDLQVRISDSGGIESNTLKLTVDLKN
jgi:hypothetical protein